MTSALRKVLVAEFIGTAMLLCTVVGSGIMAQRLSGGNDAVALLANTLATVFALYVLIETLGPISGAQFNPLVTLLMGPPKAVKTGFLMGKEPLVTEFIEFVAILIIASQLAGAVAGVMLAHAMFELPLIEWGTRSRSGTGQWLAECAATAALLFVIKRSSQVPNAKASVWVAATIGAAYWSAASTSFANPAAVVGRMFTTTFSGIAPADAMGFVAAQCVGAVLGWGLAGYLSSDLGQSPAPT